MSEWGFFLFTFIKNYLYESVRSVFGASIWAISGRNEKGVQNILPTETTQLFLVLQSFIEKSISSVPIFLTHQ